MKKTFKAPLLASLLLPGAAFAQSYTTKIYRDQNGNRQTVASGGTLRTQAGSALDLSGPTFSTALTGNPLLQNNYTDTAVANLTSASMTTLIASAAGRTIYPGGGLTIMVSGTAATATALALECSDGTLVASWPIALLVTNVPVGIFASAASGPTIGARSGRGCAASTALMLSNVGTNITTTTHVYTNVPYTVQ